MQTDLQTPQQKVKKQTELISQMEDHTEQLQTISTQGLSQHIFGAIYRTLSENCLDLLAQLERLDNKILKDWKGEKWLPTSPFFEGGKILRN